MKKPAARITRLSEPFHTEFGAVLNGVEIAYESWGELSQRRNNAILVCPAFSAHSHAASSAADPAPGWWENMIGPGKALDTQRYFVICASLLGSCYGTTGPNTENPDNGGIYAAGFPAISVRDMVSCHMRLLDQLGIPTLHGILGGSLGGMEAIEAAIHHPHRMKRVITISGTDHTRPYTAAIRHIGRRAIMLDPDFQGGYYHTNPPRGGLRLARELGTLFYRSREEFNDRFSMVPLRLPSRDGITFDVQSYLDHQGSKIVDHFDANAYLTLSLAMDLHDVSRSYGSMEAAFSRVEADVLVIGVPEDRLIPVDEQKGIELALRRLGKSVEWREISSPIGHDAFLVETEAMGAAIQEFFGRTPIE